MNRRRRGGTVWALSSMLLLMACTSGDDSPRSVTTADAYTAAIRWYVDSLPQAAPADTTDTGPALVYIVPADGDRIDAEAQSAVVADLADMSDSVTVRFADVRDDAIDVEVDDQPVKEGGALLLIGKVVEGPPPVEVTIEVYHNIDEDETFHMRIIRAGSDSYTVTGVTQVEQN